MTGLEIREAGADAIDAVMSVMETAFDPEYSEAWTRAQCLGILIVPGVWIGIATIDGVPAGFAMNRAILDEAELLLIGVAPQWRGQGVGRALMAFTLASAAARGATTIHLEVRDGNPAMQLYAGAGFAVVGRRPAYYRGKSGKSYDAVTLSRSLQCD